MPVPAAYYQEQGIKPHGRGPWRNATCPFHSDKNPSLRINIASGGYKCMGCEERGGDVVAFHMRKRGLGFADSAKELGAWEVRAHSSCEATQTPKMAARRLAVEALQKGYTPEALHAYRDNKGAPIYWRIRLRHPKTGEKWIRPIR